MPARKEFATCLRLVEGAMAILVTNRIGNMGMFGELDGINDLTMPPDTTAGVKLVLKRAHKKVATSGAPPAFDSYQIPGTPVPVPAVADIRQQINVSRGSRSHMTCRCSAILLRLKCLVSSKVPRRPKKHQPMSTWLR